MAPPMRGGSHPPYTERGDARRQPMMREDKRGDRNQEGSVIEE